MPGNSRIQTQRGYQAHGPDVSRVSPIYTSLVSRHLENNGQGLTEEEHDVLKWAAGSLYGAGSQTTVSVMMFFFLAMVLHPSIKKKAQSEIDGVLCEGRLPTLLDRPHLPYIDCILQEILRWRPVAPLIAHSSLVDDVYQGVRIPAGSVVLANGYDMTHDKNIYDQPEDFNPDRFLSSQLPDPGSLGFGLGRTICPGVYLADNLLWMVIATTLATLDILPDLKEDGTPDFPSTKYTSGAVIQPLPFRCRVIPRSPASADLISEANALWS